MITRQIIAALALAGVATSQALALDQQRILDCAALTGDEERLACYDALAESIASSTDTAEAVAPGSWTLTQAINPETGAMAMRLTTASETQLETESGSVRPELTVHCESGKSRISLDWKLYVGQGSIRMRTDFDAIPHRVAVWSIADDFQTVTSRGSDILLIKRMMRYDRLSAEVTPFGGKPVAAEFITTGLYEAIKPLRGSCRF